MEILISLNAGFLPCKRKGTDTILNNELNLEQTHKRSSHKCLELCQSELNECFPVGFVPQRPLQRYLYYLTHRSFSHATMTDCQHTETVVDANSE